jgi:hypothetical protein
VERGASSGFSGRARPCASKGFPAPPPSLSIAVKGEGIPANGRNRVMDGPTPTGGLQPQVFGAACRLLTRRNRVTDRGRGEIRPSTGDIMEEDYSVSALAGVLESPHWSLRRGAAEVLGGLGVRAQEAVPELLCALLDPEREVRVAVAYALSRIAASGPGVVLALREALASEYPDVRQFGAINLGLLGDSDAALSRLKPCGPAYRLPAGGSLGRGHGPGGPWGPGLFRPRKRSGTHG